MTSYYVFGQDPVSVQLSIKTGQGLPLHEAALNKPFIATVTINTNTSAGKVFLESPSVFDVRNQGTTTSMNSINGVTSQQTSFQYVVRAKEVGTFTLGPATVTINGDLYSSNAVQIKVEQEPVERVTRTEPWLELRMPEEQIVVGQTIALTLRFYHLGLSQLSSIEPPKIEGFLVSPLVGPTRGSQEIEGALYEYIEWQGDMLAKEVGTFTIGPAHAVYTMKARERTHIFQLLSDHFAFGMQQYETDSNAVKLKVTDLPLHKGEVNAVGTFTQLEASVNQTTAKQGEGIVYTLALDGNAALKELAHPALKLPPSLTSYDSKSTLAQNKNQLVSTQRKSFEYIIQSREPGTLTIPAQTFTFYDPHDKQFKELTSEPITLTIMSDNAANGAQKPAARVDQPAQLNNAVPAALFPLYAQGSAEFRVDTGFSDFVFWMVILLILLGIAMQWGLYWWRNYKLRNQNYLRSRASFHRAQKRLIMARRERNARELYSIFIDLFADRRGIASSQVLDSDMQVWLKETHIPEDTVRQWQQYSTTLQTYAFFDAAQIPPADIFNQAERWLALFEKTL